LEIKNPYTTLNELSSGERAKIVGYTQNNSTTQRLIEIGFMKGKEVYYIRNAPLKDPLEIQIGKGLSIALRQSEASLIIIKLQE